MTPDTASIERWLADAGRRCQSTQDFLHGLVTQLNAQGLELLRSVVNIRTLHPEVGAITYQWYKEEVRIQAPSHLILRQRVFPFGQARVLMNIVRRSVFETEPYRNSPFYIVRFEQGRVRTSIPASPEIPVYPIYQDLAGIGASGYYAREVDFTDGERNVITFTTTRAGGFTPEDIALLDAVTDRVAAHIEIFAQRLLMQTLLEIYLGEKTGRQVLEGQIQRGDIRELRSIIWFSDLRNFTRLTERAGVGVVDILNQYFETIAEPLRAQGGEILKFIGDAILAIFPIPADADAADEAAAARSALRAAFDAGEQLGLLNDRRQADGEELLLQHGIALHTGLVQYGNIGSRDRLDFTVIGSAVNLASRLEGLCSRTDEPIVLSSDLAQIVPDCTRSLGRFTLKGIEGEQEVFAPSERPE